MIRRAAVVVAVLALTPALVHAQDATLTINVSSASVYKGASNVTPVIGHVSRGTVLRVSRNLGSWVRVPWPGAPDGVGYVHVTMGRLTAGSGDTPAANASPRASSASQTTSTIPPVPRPPTAERGSAPRRAAVTAPTHVIGVGGVIGSMSTFGATARAWRDNRVGVQVGFTRDAMSAEVGTDRVTSIQFEPGVVYAPFDRVSDYVWVRPYVGSALSFRHQTLSATVPVGVESTSANGIGLRIFAGTELTFASAPRFGLSVDLGYRRFPTPFPGFDAAPLSASIAGHWYIK
jgi:hypothetical protein